MNHLSRPIIHTLDIYCGCVITGLGLNLTIVLFVIKLPYKKYMKKDFLLETLRAPTYLERLIVARLW